jgi:hypothetical protein
MDHHRLLQLMSGFRPKFVIVDTNLIDSDDALIKLKTETVGPALSQKILVNGVVSRGAMATLAAKFGYSTRYEEWNHAASNRDGLHDYYSTSKFGARRYTLYLELNAEGPPITGETFARVADKSPAEEAAPAA